MTEPFKITHIITDLDTGGAEMMLLKLLSCMDRRRFSNRVISLTGDGLIGQQIRQLGIRTDSVGMRPGLPQFGAINRLRILLYHQQSDLVQTWLYHADLIGSIAAKLAGSSPVVWNLHNFNLDPKVTKASTLFVVKLCAILSGRLPEKILCVARSAAEVHIQHGYKPDKITVIPNGFDVDRFRPDPDARLSVRAELHLEPEQPLVGMVARFDPLKDILTFLRAADLVRQAIPQVRFILCGNGLDWRNEELCSWIEQSGLREAVHLLGLRQDIPRLLASLDVLALSSIGEAFANVIGEAMACGVPCAVTDVGDSAMIVGDTGKVVPPRQPDALAAAICDLLQLPEDTRHGLGEKARRRIIEHFSLPAITAQYEDVYQQVILQSTARKRSQHSPNK